LDHLYERGKSGKWIDLNQERKAIWGEIDAMLAESKWQPARECVIVTYENFGTLELSQSDHIELVIRLAELIVSYGPFVAEVVREAGGLKHLSDVKHSLHECYNGEYESVADCVHELIDQRYGVRLAELPDSIRSHIDYEAIANKLENSFSFCRYDGRVHVFY